MFATPCSENVRRSIFGPGHEDAVVELHRLHVQDGTPRNTESWFIARCLRLLVEDRPQTAAVVSFADPTEGHVGTIYQATNAIYYGKSRPATFFRDETGRLRHPRQNGKNIDGCGLGWTPVRREGKHRYLWLVGDRRKKAYYTKLLRVKPLPYPTK